MRLGATCTHLLVLNKAPFVSFVPSARLHKLPLCSIDATLLTLLISDIYNSHLATKGDFIKRTEDVLAFFEPGK